MTPNLRQTDKYLRRLYGDFKAFWRRRHEGAHNRTYARSILRDIRSQRDARAKAAA